MQTSINASQPALKPYDALAAALHRASHIAPPDQLAAVIAAPNRQSLQSSLNNLQPRNIFVQPKYQGTAYEVLLALLRLERVAPPSSTVLFLPADHIVSDEEVLAKCLKALVKTITAEPGPVYLLGAAPRGPHDQVGYIVPWHDATLMPSGVYEFVERPDVSRARRLIQTGAFWNTFIFGGTLGSLRNLFRPRFDVAIAAFRTALQSLTPGSELARTYDRFGPADLSQDVLAKQLDSLKVVRLLNCGWWPLKSPTRPSSQVPGSTPIHHTREQAEEQGLR